MHFHAVDSGGRQVHQCNGQGVGLNHGRLRVHRLGAGQQVDVAEVELLHGHCLGLCCAGCQVGEKVARLYQRFSLLPPQHHGHALARHQGQVLKQVQQLGLLGHVHLAVVVEAQRGHFHFGGALGRHQAARVVQAFGHGVLAQVLQAGCGVCLAVVEVGALQLLAVAEDDLLFH